MVIPGVDVVARVGERPRPGAALVQRVGVRWQHAVVVVEPLPAAPAAAMAAIPVRRVLEARHGAAARTVWSEETLRLAWSAARQQLVDARLACTDEGALSSVTAMRYPIWILHANGNWRGRMTEVPRPSRPHIVRVQDEVVPDPPIHTVERLDRAVDLGETGPLSQGDQARRKALRTRHINGIQVRKKRPRGFK